MLPAEIVNQVRRIQLRTGRQVADVLAGAYVSVFKGRGVEFDEVRPYVPGDDVRTIDWNVTARMGAPYVKRYVEERQLTVLLIVDMSASLDFGSAQRSKREAAVELSALLAFSAIYNDDKVGLLLFHGEVDQFIPPRKGQKHALRVVREVLARGQETSAVGPRDRALAALPRALATSMERSSPGSASERGRLFHGRRAGAGQSLQPGSARGYPSHERQRSRRRGPWGNSFAQLRERSRGARRRSTNIAHALEFCRRVLPRRAVLFLISDFLDDGYLDALRGANRKHDVVAVRVTDRRESEFQGAGLVTLEDAETGERRLVDTSSPALRAALAEDADARTEALHRRLRGSGIDVVSIDATGSVVEPLLAFFRMREKRIRR